MNFIKWIYIQVAVALHVFIPLQLFVELFFFFSYVWNRVPGQIGYYPEKNLLSFNKHLYWYLHKWSYWWHYPLSKKVLTSVNFILWFYQCLVLYVRSKTFGKIIWRCFWEGAVYFSLSVSYPSCFSEFILKNLLLSNLEKNWCLF